ncbi:type II secretion system F family protein [Halomonas sp. McH1-25]|uniref:type II secretion system F family protein n=1 Tax=unclassified Halomonas TaxID=2609666 RepID=UPI001EF62C47|nr:MULTISPECIES: type II secretion system F family protein [unclassified Halomonas]MCG7598942.1 type II secretion system F family protein [Halomonas sp. McH1-25]MCP1342454.1 type II secretion system F family protein [Halomonas sp. FL8]MCP1362036.1 type II secretion system F family protein [Halomonas sp. BBD45]MCP1366281.1 type II secretion system F family protein [Halomonas sp. BBD48]
MTTSARTSRGYKPREQNKLYRWHWSGKNNRGKPVRGEIVAAHRGEVERELSGQSIIVKSIRRKSGLFGRGGRIKSRDVMLFARQMATMIRAGVPVLQAFNVVAESLRNPAMRSLVQKLSSDVSAGASFSEALRQRPQYFDPLFTNMVEAGEQSGSLDRMLDRVASYREKIETLKGRVRKAMYYPAAVVSVGIGVTALLLIKVVPQFESLFNGFGAELPAMTRMTIALSEFAQAYWLWGLGGLVAGIVAIRQGIKRSDSFAYRMHQLVLRLPVIGNILDKSSVARYSRTLATTFGAGVPLVDALDTAAGAAGNKVYERAVQQVRDDVSSGQQLHFAMRNVNLFPALAVQMVGIGEEAGSLDAMLNKVADFYEEEVDNKVDALTSLLEPFIIVVLGVLVGGLVVSMYLPIFELGTAI